MTGFLHRLLDLPSAVIYLIVGVFVFAEDAVLIGFIVPGETVAILAGVAASQGSVSPAVTCAVVVFAAIAGDTTGYLIGARYGHKILSLRPLRRRAKRIESAQQTLARHGGPAVLGGRFVAFLHAVMPLLAGTSHMSYRRFFAYNAAGGVLWGTGTVLAGYLAGSSYAVVEKTFGRASAIAAAAVIVAGLVAWRVHRWRRRRHGGVAEGNS
ncbi:DedA family protein [Rugosimonospora acidiphila]|uniref:DedA family protein n=1 Tax=Rugosimonospora acidiphila TaxID=556531 RepID=A0ABP9RL57_9ACTN